MARKDLIYKDKKFTINYDLINIDNKDVILFLHGWGSNKEVMKSAFLNLLPNLKHIYVDMPGFGKSLNDEVLTTNDYKEIVKLFLEKLNLSPRFIVGHSFGGKVATLLTPEVLILLSSAGIVEKKPIIVRVKIAIFKFLKIFGGSSLYKIFASNDARGMPKNMYETLKNVVNEDFSEIFRNFSNKALIFWGERDRDTSFQSGKKISQLIDNSKFFSYDGDHYFFLKYKKEIEKEIEKESLTV